jgi:hypothetical protein
LYFEGRGDLEDSTGSEVAKGVQPPAVEFSEVSSLSLPPPLPPPPPLAPPTPDPPPPENGINKTLILMAHMPFKNTLGSQACCYMYVKTFQWGSPQLKESCAMSKGCTASELILYHNRSNACNL